jgi:hypothetical protein
MKSPTQGVLKTIRQQRWNQEHFEDIFVAQKKTESRKRNEGENFSIEGGGSADKLVQFPSLKPLNLRFDIIINLAWR